MLDAILLFFSLCYVLLPVKRSCPTKGYRQKYKQETADAKPKSSLRYVLRCRRIKLYRVNMMRSMLGNHIYKARAPRATRPRRPAKVVVVRAAEPSEGVTVVASESSVLVAVAEEPERVEVVMVELPLWVEDADAPVMVEDMELESVLVMVEDSESVSVELAELEVALLEAEADEEALGAALLVLSITKGGV